MPKMAFPPPGVTGFAGHRHVQSAACQVGMGHALTSVLLGSIQSSIWS